MEPFLKGVPLKSAHHPVVCHANCPALVNFLLLTRSFSISLSRGSSLLPADQSLHYWQRAKTIRFSPFVFVSIGMPVHFDLLFCSICAQAAVISHNSPIYFSWSMFNLYPHPTLILMSRSVISYFSTSNCFHHLLAQLLYISQTLWRYNCNIVHYLLIPLPPNIHNGSKMRK